jgi:hypothetical protein
MHSTFVLPLTLDHLQDRKGIRDCALAWFNSYLCNRLQRIRVRGSLSSPHKLQYGVPQGSVLGPLLLTLYTHPLSSIISQHHLQHHIYADDTQLYIVFSPKAPSSVSSAVATIETAVTDIKTWMDAHFLKLNEHNTEILIIRRPSLCSSPSIISNITICDCDVTCSSTVRNLGVVFDTSFGLDDHAVNICKGAYFHLHSIWKVQKFLTTVSTRALVKAHVTSPLDYCNALFYGLPVSTRNKLQRVQNAAARVITRTKESGAHNASSKKPPLAAN